MPGAVVRPAHLTHSTCVVSDLSDAVSAESDSRLALEWCGRELWVKPEVGAAIRSFLAAEDGKRHQAYTELSRMPLAAGRIMSLVGRFLMARQTRIDLRRTLAWQHACEGGRTFY